MRHIVLEVAVEGIDDAAAVGQRLKHQGGDELGGVLGHQYMDVGAQFDERVRHVGHFVGGDAPADTEDDGFALQLHTGHDPFAVS